MQLLQQGRGTCCSGHVQTAALGMRQHARKQLRGAIWNCCSGPMRMVAHATWEPACMQRAVMMLSSGVRRRSMKRLKTYEAHRGRDGRSTLAGFGSRRSCGQMSSHPKGIRLHVPIAALPGGRHLLRCCMQSTHSRGSHHFQVAARRNPHIARATVCIRPLEHRQVPATCCAAACSSSQGQPTARAHCSTAIWPLRAAVLHITLFP